MKSKFQREHHNRQDRVWKEPTRCLDGEESQALWSYVVTTDHRIRRVVNQELAERASSQRLLEAFEAETRRWRFIVSGYKFAFCWDARRFADMNGLAVPDAVAVFDKVRAEAQERHRMAMNRIRRHGLTTSYERDQAGNLVRVCSLRYHELTHFLPIDDNS